MTLFPIPFILGAIVETSRLILQMAQAIRVSDLFSSGQLLKPGAVMRRITAALIFLLLFPSG